MAQKDPETRVFSRRGRRHYRKKYAVREAQLGAILVAGLGGIAIWVAYKGTQADPELFEAAPALTARESNKAADRGPLPAGLAPSGWTEGRVSVFDPTNLYVKINGREGYYKGFGFELLYFVSLGKADDETTSVDIELYDLGTAANALGAYAGERGEGVRSRVTDAGLMHLERNALMLTRGRYYIRCIGSSESNEVRAQLAHLSSVLTAIPGAALPWVYGVFAGKLGVDAGSITYTPENAFSLSFATNVYSARLADGETEAFVVATKDPAAAAALGKQFADGFLQYGDAKGRTDGVQWVADQYIGTIAGARASGSFVVGVRSAPTLEGAKAEMTKLVEAVKGLATPGPSDAGGATASAGEVAAPAPSPGGEPAPTNAAGTPGGYGDTPASGDAAAEPGSAAEPTGEPDSEGPQH